jgi:hypothetical protein
MCKQILDDLKEKSEILEIERGSTRSHSMENSLWKRLWTCRKTDCRMNEYINDLLVNIEGAKLVLFGDDINLLVTEKDESALQHKIKNVIMELESWFFTKTTFSQIRKRQ